MTWQNLAAEVEALFLQRQWFGTEDRLNTRRFKEMFEGFDIESPEAMTREVARLERQRDLRIQEERRLAASIRRIGAKRLLASRARPKQERACLHCEKPMLKKVNALFCSLQCGRSYRNDVDGSVVTKVCEKCSTVFVPHKLRPNQKRCSKKCRPWKTCAWCSAAFQGIATAVYCCRKHKTAASDARRICFKDRLRTEKLQLARMTAAALEKDNVDECVHGRATGFDSGGAAGRG